MTIIKKLIKHSSTYMIGEAIVILGSFISFPIFTRLLTIEEYGMMNLIGLTLSIVEAISSIGLRHSSQRFYSYYEKNNLIKFFYSTTIISSLAFGILGTVGIIITCRVLSVFGIITDNFTNVLFLAAFLVFTRVMSKIIGCIYRVKERPNTYAIFAIITKYLGMGCAILLVSFYLYGIIGLYAGLLIGEMFVLALYFFFMVKEMGSPIKSFSFPMLRKMTDFGFPLVISGLASYLLASGDRYLIGYFMTINDVAIYSVPYNLCGYVQGILLTGFEFAFIPIIMNEWQRSDVDKVKQEIRKVIRLCCLILFPIIFGVIALGRQLIVLLATDRYVEATYIIPYVITGEMIRCLFVPLMIGFYFYRKAHVFAMLSWFAVCLNILLNLLLIPKMGLHGAAISTLFCYILVLVYGTIKSSKYFKVEMPWNQVIIYAICAFLMFLTLKVLILIYDSNLAINVILGITIYVSIVMIVDSDMRKKVILQTQKYGRKFNV